MAIARDRAGTDDRRGKVNLATWQFRLAVL
jgi:hypothetical protein